VSNGTEDASISFRQISNGSLKEVAMVNGNIDFGDSSGVRLGDGQDFQLYHDGTDNHINVTNAQTLNIQTSGNNAIVVDANGVVTKPKHPAFLAQGATTNIGAGVSDYNYVAIPQKYDTANSYVGNTGLFTAPVAGKYWFFAHIQLNASVAGAHIAMSVNSSYQGGGGGYDTNQGWHIQTGTYVQGNWFFNLAANDTARILLYGTAASSANSQSTVRNYFKGYLVG